MSETIDTNSVPPHEFKRGSRKRPYCVAVFDGKLCGGRYDETPHLAFEDARNAELERTEATFYPPPHDWPQDEIAQLRYIAQHGAHSQDCDDRILWAADEIERLRAENEELRRCSNYDRPTDRRCLQTKDDGHRVCRYE